jgi:hypothetical protein
MIIYPHHVESPFRAVAERVAANPLSVWEGGGPNGFPTRRRAAIFRCYVAAGDNGGFLGVFTCHAWKYDADENPMQELTEIAWFADMVDMGNHIKVVCGESARMVEGA